MCADVVRRMVMNENHYPPLAEIQRVLCAATGEINRYPDMFGSELGAAIGATFGVAKDSVVIGPGSAALCLQVLRLAAGPGAEVVYPWPSFEGYPLLIGNSGATGVPVPLRAHTHDLTAMAAAVTEQTRAVLLCNPNNPTGTVLPAGELARFLADLPSGVLVILDEAYRDFTRPGATEDGVELFARHADRLCVLRTFSKSYGLAGLRVGFVVAGPALAAQLRRDLPFLSVNSLGQVAAHAGLAARDELLARCELIAADRDAMRAELVEAGWSVPDSQANFLWLATESAIEFAEFCQHNGVLVRAYPDLGVRVTISEPEANTQFVRLAVKFAGAA